MPEEWPVCARDQQHDAAQPGTARRSERRRGINRKPTPIARSVRAIASDSIDIPDVKVGIERQPDQGRRPGNRRREQGRLLGGPQRGARQYIKVRRAPSEDTRPRTAAEAQKTHSGMCVLLDWYPPVYSASTTIPIVLAASCMP